MLLGFLLTGIMQSTINALIAASERDILILFQQPQLTDPQASQLSVVFFRHQANLCFCRVM